MRITKSTSDLLAESEVARAALPANYERSKKALADCLRVDECKEWADKAAALASYARQSRDDALLDVATRIRGRAVRRCGELLKELEPAKGGTPYHQANPTGVRAHTGRISAASAAGMSRNQAIQALRVASIPDGEFEAIVEGPKPPTVKQLEKLGTRNAGHLNGRDKEEFAASIRARGRLRELADVCATVTPESVVRGANAYDIPEMMAWAESAGNWLKLLVDEMRRIR